MATFDEWGREVPDPRPVDIPAGMRRPLSLKEQIQQAIRNELSRRAAEDGEETFEEADDFEVDEDGEPVSPYEFIDLEPELGDVDADPPKSAKPVQPDAPVPEDASGKPV